MTADPIDPRTLRHELRTPLNQIIGYAELLEEEVVEAGHHVYVSDLRRIQSAARRLHGRIDEAIGLRSQTAPAPVPDDPANKRLPSANVTSRPFAIGCPLFAL